MTEKHNRNRAPYGWYIGAYLTRFIEIGDVRNDDPEARFITWENTVIVKAENLDDAYDKVEAIGREHAEPYKGGPDAIDVQWAYVGVTELLPIYEELEDGAEVMWAERKGVKLKNILRSVREKGTFCQ